MKRLALCLAIGGIAALSLLSGSPAQAQATRTWVSGVGDDANPCSRTAPCKTWAGAISKTANGGEIDALDPGGFGGVTITKSITLDGGGGQVASILVAGTNGVIVAATGTDVVIIKNIRFQGLLGNGSNSANAGISAVKFLTGKRLIIEKCEIYGFNTAGVWLAPTAAGASVTVDSTQIYNSTTGVLVDGSGGSINASVSNSVISQNGTNGITAQGSAHAGVVADNNQIGFNGAIGLQTNGPNAVAIIGRNMINGNATGVQTSGGAGTGQVQTFGDNQIGGNSTDVNGTLTPASTATGGGVK